MANGDFDDLYEEAGQEFDLDPRWIKAVAQVESNEDPYAFNASSGAAGIMQFMPGTATEMGVREPFLAHEAVRGGARYLRQLLDRFNDPDSALAAYNAGPNAPHNWSPGYVEKVNARFADLKRQPWQAQPRAPAETLPEPEPAPPLDFSDLLKSPPAAPQGPAPALDFSDLLKKPKVPTPGPPPDPGLGFVEPAAPPRQSAWAPPTNEAQLNALAAGFTGGIGSMASGAGRAVQEAGIRNLSTAMEIMDRVDAGEAVPEQADVLGYQHMSPEQRQQARAEAQEGLYQAALRRPNAAMRAGHALTAYGERRFPVPTDQAGIITGALGMVGGLPGIILPAVVGGAVGGPLGAVAGGAAAIGAQSYEGTYQQAIAKGASPQEADQAARGAAAVQMGLMSVPVGRLIQNIPMPLRDGFVATMANLGKHGIEFGSFNALAHFADNYVAQQTFDPERKLSEGVGAAALEGTLAGLVIPAAGMAFRGRAERPQAEKPYTPDWMSVVEPEPMPPGRGLPTPEGGRPTPEPTPQAAEAAPPEAPKPPTPAPEPAPPPAETRHPQAAPESQGTPRTDSVRAGLEAAGMAPEKRPAEALLAEAMPSPEEWWGGLSDAERLEQTKLAGIARGAAARPWAELTPEEQSRLTGEPHEAVEGQRADGAGEPEAIALPAGEAEPAREPSAEARPSSEPPGERASAPAVATNPDGTAAPLDFSDLAPSHDVKAEAAAPKPGATAPEEPSAESKSAKADGNFPATAGRTELGRQRAKVTDGFLKDVERLTDGPIRSAAQWDELRMTQIQLENSVGQDGGATPAQIEWVNDRMRAQAGGKTDTETKPAEEPAAPAVTSPPPSVKSEPAKAEEKPGEVAPFEEGHRVRITEGPLAGRHGVVTRRTSMRMQSILGGATTPTTHTYEVTTDGGATAILGSRHVEAESGEAPKAIPDPVYDGHTVDPASLNRSLEHDRAEAKRLSEVAGRARTPKNKLAAMNASNERYAVARAKREVLDAWKAAHPEEAARLFPAKSAAAAKPQETAPEPKSANPPPADIAADLPIVEHVTGKGKTLRGVVRTDLTQAEAKAIDKFTFKKGNGWFIREQHLPATEAKAPEAERPRDLAALNLPQTVERLVKEIAETRTQPTVADIAYRTGTSESYARDVLLGDPAVERAIAEHAAPTKAPEAAKPAAPVNRYKIGTNADGHPLYADENGVRSYVENGIRVTEPVQVRPGGPPAVDLSRRGGEFLTEDERKAAAPPSAESPPAEAPEAPFKIGDKVTAKPGSGWPEGLTGEVVRTQRKADGSWSLSVRAPHGTITVNADEWGLAEAPAERRITRDDAFPAALAHSFPNAKMPTFDQRTGLRTGSKDALDFLAGWELAEAGRPRSLATSGPMQTGHDSYGWFHEPVPTAEAPKVERVEGRLPTGEMASIPRHLTEQQGRVAKAVHEATKAMVDLRQLIQRGTPNTTTLARSANEAAEKARNLLIALEDATGADLAHADPYYEGFMGFGEKVPLAQNRDSVGLLSRALDHLLASHELASVFGGRFLTEGGAPKPAKEPAQPAGENAGKPEAVPEQPQAEAPKPEAEAAPEPPRGERPEDAPGFGANNTTFTADMAEKARATLREKFARLNAGFDPEMMAAGFNLAGYYIEGGLRKFPDYARAMLKDFGDAVRPFLKHFYNSVRDYPGFDNRGMDDARAVDAALKQIEERPTSKPEETTNERPADRRAVGEPGSRPPEEGGVGTRDAEGARPPEVVEPAPAEDAGRPAGAGDRGETGDGAGAPVLSGGEGVHPGGVASNGRSGDRRARVADQGTGGDEGAREPAPASIRPNFHIADPARLIGGTPKVRFDRNKRAIEALRAIEEEQRPPNQEELDAMAAYIGWGSFGQDLFQGTWADPRPKPNWQKESAWLREHLGKEGWESANASIINAHYTDPPTVKAMWDMVRHMGFQGGRVLEPAMGIGNFFGMMPRDLMARSGLTGIELDKTTAAMAKLLYPDAGIHQKPYQDSRTPDNFYDLVIGNWPFAAEGPADRRYDRLSPSLHDYFFLKALDQTRPGGLVVGITSAGTMDKAGRAVRMELAKKGDLVAAFRLPTGAFEQYAGTSVVTDIIILRKRPAETMEPASWIDATEVPTPAGPEVRINRYFQEHPENVLGTIDWGHGTTSGRPGMIVHRPADLEARLEALAERLPTDAYQPVVRGNEPRFITNNTTDRHNSVTIGPDGRLYQVSGERLVALDDIAKMLKVGDRKLAEKRAAQVRDLVGLRKAYGALIDAERDAAPDTEKLRDTLRREYEAFRAAHGAVGESDGLAILQAVKDPAYAMLSALERPDGSPARILTETTIRSRKKLENPSTPEAYVLARNESTNVDMDRVAELAGRPRDEVERELLESGAVYRTPGDGFEAADLYLGGNVRRKLREAQDAVARGEDMQRSVGALEKVIPPTVPYFQIEAKLGAPWVPDAVYRQFLGETLALPPDRHGEINIRFAGGRWRVRIENHGILHSPEAETIVGVPFYRFDKLASAAMGNQTIKIRSRNADGDLVFDQGRSDEANAKAAELREKFQDWIWTDPQRTVQMETAYNESMNAIARPSFDGAFLDMSGMALRRGDDPFSLRKHQINAIWRGVVLGRGLFAHEVGTGKTYTMGGIAIEGRRFGVFRKPLLFAHNANSSAVAREIQEMYPGARILYVPTMEPAEVATTLHRIANDDWDLVVMPHSLIDRMALSKPTLEALAADQIAELETEAMEAARDDGVRLSPQMMDDPEAMKRVRSVTAKQLVHQRNAIIANIEKQANRATREGAVPFENLGVDAIMVDEAHEFKKPPLATRMQLKGLNTATSNRSIALNFLTGYLKKNNNGRGVYLFTGTPVTNTLNELFNQMRYFMDDRMALDGVSDWDSWFNTFASAISDVELAADGSYEPVTRLQAFVNADELVRMASEFTDVVQAKDMPEFADRSTPSGKTLSSPDLTKKERDFLENGRTDNPVGRPYKKVISDVAEMSPAQWRILDLLQERSRQFKAMSKKDRREAMLSGDRRSPIIVETDAANASLDARLFDPDAPDWKDSKVNRIARNVLGIYKSDDRAAQAIFVDRGYNAAASAKDSSNKYVLVKDLVDKLVAGGIPRGEIAIVAGGVSADKKKQIADAMNSGKLRVVIGQSGTLGVGVNMQRYLRAMHHMDAPWRPGDLEQRNGRGERQGNEWNTVLEYRYVTEGIDGRRWQVLSTKDRFIKQFINRFNDTSGKRLGVLEGDAADISDQDPGIVETLAHAAGDPRLMLRSKYQADISRLERRERLHTFGVADMLQQVKSTKREIEWGKKQVAYSNAIVAPWEEGRARADKVREAAGEKGVWETASVGGRELFAPDEIQNAIDAEVRTLARGEERVLAVVNGLEVVADWKERLRDEPHYAVRPVDSTEAGAEMAIERPTLGQIRGAAIRAGNRVHDWERRVEDLAASIPRLEQAAKAPFPQQEALNAKRQQLANLVEDLQANPAPPPGWLRHGAPVDSEIYVDGKPREVRGHGMDDDYFLITDEGKVPYLDAKTAQGVRIFDARPKPQREAPGGGAPPPSTPTTGPSFGRRPTPLYSAVERAVSNLRQAKGTGEQMLAQIMKSPGVKAEEVKWIGLDTWLRDQKSVPAQQIADYVRANKLDVQEVLRGEPGLEWKEVKRFRDGMVVLQQGRGQEAPFRRAPRAEIVILPDGGIVATSRHGMVLKFTDLEEAKRFAGDEVTASALPVVHPDYKLPGGREGYRELLITLPGQKGDQYRSSHWDESNVLAHIRFSDRRAPDGKRVLLIEESQSDWHQQGRKEGYRGAEDPEYQKRLADAEKKAEAAADAARQAQDTAEEATNALFAYTRSPEYLDSWQPVRDAEAALEAAKRAAHGSAREKLDAVFAANEKIDAAAAAVAEQREASGVARRLEELRQARDAASDALTRARRAQMAADGAFNAVSAERIGAGVPDAPFKTSWPALTLRRMIAWAAEHGYDRVAWSPGEVHADRYGLKKRVDLAEFSQTPEQFGTQRGTLRLLDDEHALLGEHKITSREQVDDILGENAAEQLMAKTLKRAPDGGSAASYLNMPDYVPDVMAGGEGMRGFYDRILPAAANKIIGRYGAKVRQGEVEAGLGADADAVVHQFDITPDLRRAAQTEGMPLFRRDPIERDQAPHPAAVQAMLDEATRRLGGHVLIEAYDAADKVFTIKFRDPRTGEVHEEQVFGYAVGRLIRLALEGDRTQWNLDHEVLHALVKLGVIKPEEMRALERQAIAEDWAREFNIDERYPGLDAESRLEEAIAEKFAQAGMDPAQAKGLIRRIMDAIREFLARVRNALQGAGFQTAEDVFARMRSGEMGRRRPGEYGPEVGARTIEDSLAEAAGHRDAVFGRRPRQAPEQERAALLAEHVKRTAQVAKLTKPLKGALKAIVERPKMQELLNGHAADMAQRKLDAISRDIVMGISPMSGGTPEFQALAKQFANDERARAYHLKTLDDAIKRQFPAPERALMGEALDQQSELDQALRDEIRPLRERWTEEGRAAAKAVAERGGTSYAQTKARNKARADVSREIDAVEADHRARWAGKGLDRLNPDQRALVELLSRMAEKSWDSMLDEGIVNGEAIPHYMPRRFVEMVGEGGDMRRIPGSSQPGSPQGLEQTGSNIRTGGPRFRAHREAEMSLAGARAKFGDSVDLVRDIRALIVAIQHSERAVASRQLIKAIKALGENLGAETVSFDKSDATPFTMADHPAFWHWEPRYQRDRKGAVVVNDEGQPQVVKGEDGRTIMDRKPIFVARGMEGPLRAIMRDPPGEIYSALMSIKGFGTSIIMASPMIHNAVIWGRAFELAPGKMLSFSLYRLGNRIRTGRSYTDAFREWRGQSARDISAQQASDGTQFMDKMIRAGMVPINGGWLQDILGIAQDAGMPAGKSFPSKVAGAVAGAIAGPQAKRNTREAVDAFGDFWHGTLLWDRIADLQAGIAYTIHEDLMRKGLTDREASMIAAHFANRFAGVLPAEGMNNTLRKVLNGILFSRQFTLGNMALIKDAFTGLPADVRAQLGREGEKLAADATKSMARRMMVASLLRGLFLTVAMMSLVQSGAQMLLREADDEGDGFMSKLGARARREVQGYARRFAEAIHERNDNPWQWINPLAWLDAPYEIAPMHDNEPGKQDRIFIGTDNQGRAIYARLPSGKSIEELRNWFEKPGKQLRAKLSTFAGPVYSGVSGRDSLDRPLYDADDGAIESAGKFVLHFMKSQVPLDVIQGGYDYVTGEPDPGMSLAKSVLPLTTGITVSRGDPLGPEGAIQRQVQQRHQAKLNEAWPDAVKLAKAGKLDEAVEKLVAAGEDPQRAVRAMIGILVPQKKTAPSGFYGRTFELHATPEDRRRLENVAR